MALKFIDLFAGLGGFHFALKELGCECVFASEIKDDLRNLYNINFPDCRIEGDITKIAPEKIPHHDILCAGFPCQPFSQAGKRQGFKDEKERGNLFDYICEIVKKHRPRYILLENVANLKGHDNQNTWNVIYHKLNDNIEKGGLNYEVKHTILSPHQFGIPHFRRRIYIVCENRDFGSLDNFNFPTPNNKTCDIRDIIDETDTDYLPLRKETRHQLNVWQNFIDLCKKHKTAIPSFPIWAMEFGATYEYKDVAPAYQTINNLCKYRGKFGKEISGYSIKECLACIPNYAQTDKDRIFPNWKIRYIEQNRHFYSDNKEWLDLWIEQIKDFDNSFIKMEWNCGKSAKPTLDDKIIQFRASGIRVKLPTFAPSLNLCNTQIPVLPWVSLPQKSHEADTSQKGRYLTRREAARLQGMDFIKFGNEQFQLSSSRSFEALGNAVNVTIVKEIAKNLLRQ